MPIKALRKTESTVHAFIMSADLSGSIDKTDFKKKNHSIVFIQINFLLSCVTFFSTPLFTILIAQYRATNKADYHYLLLQSVSGIFEWSRKNLGLFMSLCIDLAFVRMNCRSIGLPPGRLNEQAKHWSLLLSAISLRTFLQKKKKRCRGVEGKGCNDFQFPALATLLSNAPAADCPLTKDDLREFIFHCCLAFAWWQQSITEIFCPAICVTNNFMSNLYSMSIPHYSLSKANLNLFLRGIWIGIALARHLNSEISLSHML